VDLLTGFIIVTVSILKLAMACQTTSVMNKDLFRNHSVVAEAILLRRYLCGIQSFFKHGKCIITFKPNKAFEIFKVNKKY